MYKNTTKVKGFTMVELLVTISIIAILSAIVYASFGQARASARDDIRQTSLEEVRLALELYKAQNGRYPANCRNDTNWAGTTHATYGASCSAANYITGLTPDFIASLPWDPNTTASRGYLYRTNAAGTEYKLLAWNTVEVQTISSVSDEYARCSTAAGACASGAPATTYSVHTTGADTW